MYDNGNERKRWFFPPTEIGSLISLTLKGVDISADGVDLILSKSPLLEKLRIDNAGVLRKVTIRKEPQTLKSFETDWAFENARKVL
ncbi:hypothetical protein OSB04_027208 [Centaurea solstitialis]|uniref:Uncharacterized protein n=1 Tax=Centaurea solstitialis TaxID=347529 RepID=A0AA38SWX2_9ASTR|nr:hypothetical protein OSB04_027208 [Centaurea solstitialis]